MLKGWVSNSFEEEEKEIEMNLQQKAVKYLFFITTSIKSELERYKATVVLQMIDKGRETLQKKKK